MIGKNIKSLRLRQGYDEIPVVAFGFEESPEDFQWPLPHSLNPLQTFIDTPPRRYSNKCDPLTAAVFVQLGHVRPTVNAKQQKESFQLLDGSLRPLTADANNLRSSPCSQTVQI